MTEKTSVCTLVRYFCTAGRGLEPLLAQELRTKLAAEDVCQISGKVLFSTLAGMDSLRELKSAERLFLLVRQDAPITLPAHTCPARTSSLLQSRLLGNKSQWAGAAMTWSRLQGETAGAGTNVKPANAAPGPQAKTDGGGEQRGREGRREGKESQDPGKRKRGTEQREGGEGDEGVETGRTEEEGCQRSDNPDEKRSSGKRRKKVGDEQESQAEEETSRQTSAWRERDEDEGVWTSQGGDVGSTATQAQAAAVRRGGESPDNGARTAPTGRGREERCSSETADRGSGEPDPQRESEVSSPPLGVSPPPLGVSFRVNCKLSGPVSRCLSAQDLGRVIGSGLGRLSGWTVDLRNPQLEVSVYLSADHSIVGIPLTRLPLAHRSYIRTTGLRSTVAWALGSLAHIQPGWCVLDPMCGVGTILLEAAREHRDVHFLGVDIDDGQLQRANQNTAFADLTERIHLLKASCCQLPLASGSVDAVVCDLPFGRKFNTKTNMADGLSSIIAEMERVLRVGGSLVILLTPQMSCQLKKLQADPGPTATPTQEPESLAGPPPLTPRPPLSSLRLQSTHRVSLGAIDGLIHSYMKIQTS